MSDIQSIIENLTIKELRELRQLLNLELFDRTKPDAVIAAPSPFIGRQVIVRTYSAGVHFGLAVSHKGKEVELANAKRIWKWVGANTLHEIALRGVGCDSKISEAVPSVLLTEAIEIIPVSQEAAKILEGAKWAK